MLDELLDDLPHRHARERLLIRRERLREGIQLWLKLEEQLPVLEGRLTLQTMLLSHQVAHGGPAGEVHLLVGKQQLGGSNDVDDVEANLLGDLFGKQLSTRHRKRKKKQNEKCHFSFFLFMDHDSDFSPAQKIRALETLIRRLEELVDAKDEEIKRLRAANDVAVAMINDLIGKQK